MCVRVYLCPHKDRNIKSSGLSAGLQTCQLLSKKQAHGCKITIITSFPTQLKSTKVVFIRGPPTTNYYTIFVNFRLGLCYIYLALSLKCEKKLFNKGSG